MKIVTLLENKSTSKELKSNHGFSLYIEWNNKKILFDLGPNKNYLKNAKKLGLNLKEINYVVVSHGHYDHAKQLKHFMKFNDKAELYIKEEAFQKHVFKLGSLVKDIGIKKLKTKDRVHYINGTNKIMSGFIITSDVNYKEEVLSDERLYVLKDGEYKKDDFKHEIYLVLQDNNKNFLLTGCSHKGIQNIVETLEEKLQLSFDYVIGGYHLMRYKKVNIEYSDYLKKLGTSFNERDTKFYACHCTGDDAFDTLSEHMDNLYHLHTGSIIEV